MSDQSSEIDTALKDRAIMIGRISQANAEHLRLLQRLSGLEILLMKDPDSSEWNKEKSDAEISVVNSQSGIHALEAKLDEIDRDIEVTLNKET